MPGGVVPFDLFVSHNAPHVAKVNRDALREHGDDLGFLLALLAADRLFLGRIAGNGLHAQQILNKREFLLALWCKKPKSRTRRKRLGNTWVRSFQIKSSPLNERGVT